MTDFRARIRAFLAAPDFVVAGASSERSKFGNRVLRCYLTHGHPVFGLNRTGEAVEGVACFQSLSELPDSARSLSLVTPPSVTEALVEACPAAGIERVWMQPGAQSSRAIERAEALGLEPIYGGPCLLVELGC